jgi:hypothetical protein
MQSNIYSVASKALYFEPSLVRVPNAYSDYVLVIYPDPGTYGIRLYDMMYVQYVWTYISIQYI